MESAASTAAAEARATDDDKPKTDGRGPEPKQSEVEDAREQLERLISEIQKVFVGQESVVKGTVIGLLSQGNVLLEGAPGLGKTLLVRVLSECVHLKFSRIQFTPDLMPADITGTQTLLRTPDGGTELVFKPGPIFANIVLADEINRATPKTQSALLEAMQEHAVTVAGERRVLEEPFFVLATQNPLEMEGTYSLPEAQLDRFLLKVDVGFPSFEVLREIGELTTGNEMPTVKPVMTGEELVALQHLLRRVICAPHVTSYAARLALATHPGSELAPASIKKYVQYGASPRAVQALMLAGRAEALLSGRSWASADDLRKVAHMVLRHRMILGFEAELEHVTPDQLVDHVLKAVPDSGNAIDRALFNKVIRLKLATPGVAAGRQAGDRRSPFMGRGVEFADYRPYIPGDDLRLVDWNVYSRLDTVLVRLFHEDRNLSVQICVDASTSMKYGEPRKIDYAGELAAALTLIGLKNRDSIGLSCSGGTGPVTVVRGQNENTFPKALQYLEMVEATGIDDPVRTIKAQLAGSKPDRLFVISDMLKEEAEIDRLLRVISASSRRPVLLHVLGSEELAPDLRYPQRVIDAENEAEVRILGGRVAERAYREALGSFLDDLRQRCRALRIQYVESFTTLPVADLLNQVMRRLQVVESASGATR